MTYDYGIPDYALEAFEQYKRGEHGFPFGGFLTAILANDLVGAVERADAENVRLLKNYASYLYNEMPGRTGDAAVDFWGSYDAVDHRIAEQRARVEGTVAEAPTVADLNESAEVLAVADPTGGKVLDLMVALKESLASSPSLSRDHQDGAQ